MAIKKIRMRPEGANDYGDILHPETTADQVKFNDGSTVESHKTESATIKHKAKEIGLEDTSSNFTAVNIEGAMKELFTNVSNGKDLVSGAITDLDDNVVIPTNPTFSDLSDAIGEISTGKKWAVGKAPAIGRRDFIDSLGATKNVDAVMVTDLDFKPTTVLLINNGFPYGSGTLSYNISSGYPVFVGRINVKINSDVFFHGGFMLPSQSNLDISYIAFE